MPTQPKSPSSPPPILVTSIEAGRAALDISRREKIKVSECLWIPQVLLLSHTGRGILAKQAKKPQTSHILTLGRSCEDGRRKERER